MSDLEYFNNTFGVFCGQESSSIQTFRESEKIHFYIIIYEDYLENFSLI